MPQTVHPGRPISLPKHGYNGLLHNENLKTRARWIRDDLDPMVAREGPDYLHADDVLTLVDFFTRLRDTPVPVETLRSSRIHCALLEIAGRATRWPRKLIDKVDELIEYWETVFGPLNEVGIDLFEPGGRLHGITSPEDTDKERLLVKWMRAKDVHVSPMVARRHGNLDFSPGE